jgi:hypothetical protein
VHGVPKGISTVFLLRSPSELLQVADAYSASAKLESTLPDEKSFRLQGACIAATGVLQFVKSLDGIDKTDSENEFTALTIRAGALLALGDFTRSAIDAAVAVSLKQECPKLRLMHSQVLRGLGDFVQSHAELTTGLALVGLTDDDLKHLMVKELATFDSTKEPAGVSCMVEHVYCDLDGVLAGFDEGIVSLTGMRPDDLRPKALWRAVQQCRRPGGFFGSLGWHPGGEELWSAIHHWGHDDRLSILTGLPHGGETWAAQQKKSWCARYLSRGGRPLYKEVITCMSRDKHRWATPTSLLIDDRESNGEDWVRAGGIFIHHITVERTLYELSKIGVVKMVFPTPPTSQLVGSAVVSFQATGLSKKDDSPHQAASSRPPSTKQQPKQQPNHHVPKGLPLSSQACRNFGTMKGCAFGDKCRFYHNVSLS